MTTQPASKPPAIRLFVALCAVLVVAGIYSMNDYLLGAGVVLLIVPLFMFLGSGLRAQADKAAEQQRIWTQGTPARARVVTLRPTGSRRHQDPQVELGLEVLAPEPYRVQLISLISLVALPRVQPECQVDVRVDPADPKRVAIDPALIP